jgi:glycosyltransferase involved in cell wall biosynthesis
MAVYMARGRLRLNSAAFERELAWWCNSTFDWHLAQNLPECDALVTLSGCGLAAGREQKRRGGRWVCDRCSSHISFHHEILVEEYARWGQVFRGVDPRVLAKEAAEYAEADLVTVPSSFAYRSFIAKGIPAKKVALVPYGVDLQRFRPLAEPANDVFQVLFVGQVSLRKGVPYLLEAFRAFEHPRKKLTIIGSVQPEIQPFLRNLEGEIAVLGPRPQEEVKQWMSRSHVMVLPSIEEGLATVQGQAMACGCPVIGTDHSGAEDLFTDNVEGFIVPIRNAEAIRDKLERLAGDSELRSRMSEARLVRVRTLGGWSKYGSNFHQALSRLLTA